MPSASSCYLGFLWLLPMAFITMLTSIERNVRAEQPIMANPIGPLLKVAFMGVVAMMWGGVLFDQLPCFLGVPNCDSKKSRFLRGARRLNGLLRQTRRLLTSWRPSTNI